MSRFVRASKYRHVFEQSGKKDQGFENVKVTGSAWDTNVISASAEYISINWNASGGGAFAILPLPSPFVAHPSIPYKLPDSLPLARSHTAPVLDTEWSPHDDSLVASAGEDGKVMIWKVSPDVFEGWGAEGWVPKDFDPVWRIDASPRKVGQVLFHPTAENVLASASGEHLVKLWDLARTEDPQLVLSGHTDTIQSIAFSPTGTLLATTCRDRKLRLFDSRAGGDAIHVVDGHGGIKCARVTWMGDLGKVATTGFSKMSERQVGIWDVGQGLANETTTALDQSAGIVMPFWSDNNILFLAGKGDGNIRYYEYESSSLYALSEYKTSNPQRGMCFLPRRALNISECEIARAYKVHGSSIEPIAFIVPRKADSFQSDIYPPAPAKEPSLTAGEYFSGRGEVKRKLVSLDSGKTVTSSGGAGSIPTKTTSAPIPAPASIASSFSQPASASTPTAPPMSVSKSYSQPESTPVRKETTPPPLVRKDSASPAAKSASPVEDPENSQLKAELREAREKIRNLELQLEATKANAKKAAEALLNV
ncbi:uncharacterized protein EV420DRAFT_1558479 [Desarmillaria tabescens]|uniref:Coronin n=1 Tax=Armillaria tabescens TaxID=1929756 RepID=A0AA39MZW3_ARMTA|nr:uncharacterized protein EV420DRAFT_1558479 [Desarmillaria tabescens]KAK0452822.1 hypothetical protein EV420DRAFT_1558479 [Desarmillaria tabescens]